MGIIATNVYSLAVVKDGVGVNQVDVFYYLSSSSTSLIGGTWETTAPEWESGKYMWQKTVTTYTDGSSISSEPVCITGADGNDGKGINSIIEYYYQSSSPTSLSGGTWTETYPGWEDGKYIWTKSIITYSDGSTSETTPICATGQKGDAGTSSYMFTRYSSTEAPHSDMYEVPTDDTLYIGTYISSVNSPSTDPADYDWVRYRSEDVLSVKITADNGTNFANDGKTVSLTATAKQGGKNVSGTYKWYKDGAIINDATSSTYSTSCTGLKAYTVFRCDFTYKEETVFDSITIQNTVTVLYGDTNPYEGDSVIYEGSIWIDTSTDPNTYYRYDGENWTEITQQQYYDYVGYGQGRTTEFFTTKIKQTADDITLLANRVTVTEDKIDENYSEIKQTADSITSEVSSMKTEFKEEKEHLASVESKVTQNADKISWVVKSGTSASNMELTDECLNVIAENINLTGKVTFNSLDSSTQNKINDAQSTAELAQGTAENANATANTAKSTAESANSTADIAKNTADSAKSTADEAKNWIDANGVNLTNMENMVLKWTNNAVSTSTTIDGGWISTNTITAEKIALGDFTNYVTVNESNSKTAITSNHPFGSDGNTVISDGYISKTKTTNQYIALSNYCVNSFENNDELYYSFTVKGASNGTCKIGVWFYKDDKTYGALYSGSSHSFTTSDQTYSGTIKLTNCKSYGYFAIGVDDSTSTKGQIYVKDVSVRKKNGGNLIVDGSITANKLDVNILSAITANVGQLIVDGYLTTSSSRTSYNQAVAGLTFDKDGIGGWGSSSKYFNLTKDGQLTAVGIDVSGKITASSGKIGNWTISTALYNSNGGSSLSSTNANTAYIGTDGLNFYQSSTTYFKVTTSTGVLSAAGADISGKISASSGKIGNWTIGAALYNSSGGSSLSSTTANTAYIGTDGLNFYQSSSAYFKVDTSTGKLTCAGAEIIGKITATSGVIGGWNVNSNYIYNSQDGGSIYITSKSDNSSYWIRTHDAANGGGNRTFSVSKTGELYAKGATISGNITCNGKITITKDNLSTDITFTEGDVNILDGRNYVNGESRTCATPIIASMKTLDFSTARALTLSAVILDNYLSAEKVIGRNVYGQYGHFNNGGFYNLECDSFTAHDATVFESTLAVKGLLNPIAGSYVHTAKGTSGSAGYVKVAQIKIKKEYVNAPIAFRIFQRGMDETTLYIRFANENNSDPALDKFTYIGNPEMYLVKSATSTWDLYIKKSDGYDSICVSQYHNSAYNDTGMDITWTDVHAKSLPSGFKSATLHIPNDSAWITINSFLNSFSQASTSWTSTCGYRKIGNHVYLKGCVKTPSSWANSASYMFQLPAGYRPNTRKYVLNPTTLARIARIYVDTNGYVSLEWTKNLSDGSNVSGELSWVQIDMDFLID